ncbi:MAG: hypothetical protein ACTH6Y_08650 [Vibrio hibernica]
MKRFLTIFLSLASVGCSSVVHNYESENKSVNEPPIGSLSQARIGDVLIKTGTVNSEDVLLLTHDIDTGRYLAKKGMYIKIGEKEGRLYYAQSPSSTVSIYIDNGIVTQPLSSATIMLIKGKSELCVLRPQDIDGCLTTTAYVERQIDTPMDMELLTMNGITSNVLTLKYKSIANGEVVDTNNIEYDLTTSKFVQYKNAKIEILSINGTNIEYKVVSSF